MFLYFSVSSPSLSWIKWAVEVLWHVVPVLTECALDIRLILGTNTDIF